MWPSPSPGRPCCGASGLIRPHRTGGGHRLFSQEDVERLLWIKHM
ncbi:MerR family transcriptional regulator, partial [Thermoflexus sp.]